MAGKEGFVNKGINKGLGGWQSWNKIELVAEGAGVAAGLTVAPWLLVPAATLGAINLAQMGVIHEVQKRREKKGLARSGVIYQKAKAA
jgi:hypothetical protein